MTWAVLIKSVFEVDPLKCPKCGGTMKIVSFIEEKPVIEKILRQGHPLKLKWCLLPNQGRITTAISLIIFACKF